MLSDIGNFPSLISYIPLSFDIFLETVPFVFLLPCVVELTASCTDAIASLRDAIASLIDEFDKAFFL